MKPLKPGVRRQGRRFVLFGMVGVLNTTVDFAVYGVALAFGAPPAYANVVAFATANPMSYIVNATVTFRDGGRPARLSLNGYARFAAAHLVSLMISTGLVFWLAPLIGPFAAKLLAVVVTLLVNFSASALLVFRSGAPKTGEGSPVGRPESL